MQIGVLGGGVDSVTDYNSQVPWFESRIPDSSLPFSNSTGHDPHDVIVRFGRSRLGYANTHRVTQPMILICLFQVIIQQNMIDIKYLSIYFRQHRLVVTVSDW